MDALDLLKASDVELLHRADACLRQAGSALDTPPPCIDDAVRLRLFLEAHSYLSEILRRRAEKAAVDDKTREHRRFLTELFVIGGLIVVEIVLSVLGLSEGRQQATILEQMKTSTAKTAEAIQHSTDLLKTLAEEQSASLKILQQQEGDRLAQAAKKPKPVLYVGHVLLAKPHGPLKPSQESDTSAMFDFVLRNVGDANANKIIFRVLVPPDVGGVSSNTSFFPIYPASDLPDRPVRAFLLPLESLRAKNYVQFSLTFLFPKGHPPFQVMFNADAEEIRSDTPLGVLTITPRTSAGQSAPPAPPKP